jgi:hypothetical protein
MTRHLTIKIPEFKTLNMIAAVILAGLLVSGIMIIKNINKEFATRKIAGKFQEFKYATLSFNNIYSGLPGDISNASFYWKDVTKDGNANRKIEHELGEGIAAFQQLQLAELIKLPYNLTGKWQNDNDGILRPEENTPGDKNTKTTFYFNYSNELSLNVFGYGENDGKAGIPAKPALTPNEAYILDLMIDDGYPSKGSLIAASDTGTGCFIAGEYKKEKESKECLVLFKL